MKIIAVYNIKGGVGKTTTAVNIAYAASISGKKTLLVDLDSQGASTFYFKIEQGLKGKAKKTLFGGQSISDSIKKTEFENLDILPADPKYIKLDILLNELDEGKKWLKKLLSPVKKEYDVIILDCPPTLSTLADNVFKNSDVVLVPIIPTVLSVRTYEQLIEYFTDNKYDVSILNPFFSMLDRRKSMHNDIQHSFSERFKETINLFIPYNSEVEKMGEYMTPVVKKHPNCEASENYIKLWNIIYAV